QPRDRGLYAWPFDLQESSSFLDTQRLRSPQVHEHPPATALLDQLLIYELLIALQFGDRIDAEFRGDAAHGRQGIPLLEQPLQNHRDDAVAKLPIDRLALIPLRWRLHRGAAHR